MLEDLGFGQFDVQLISSRKQFEHEAWGGIWLGSVFKVGENPVFYVKVSA